MKEKDTTNNFGQYGVNFQRKIVQALIIDHQWAKEFIDVLQVKYFDVKYLAFLAEKYYDYWMKYKSFPSMSILGTLIKDDLKGTGDEELIKSQIIAYLQDIKNNPDPGDILYVKEKALDFCKKQALKAAFETAIDQMADQKYERIVDTIKKAVMVGTPISTGHDFFEDAEARFNPIVRNPIPTGYPELDSKEYFQGGIGAGELAVVSAATGVGKCTNRSTLINIKYTGIKINGKLYKPWDKLQTDRGIIYARDILESDTIL